VVVEEVEILSFHGKIFYLGTQVFCHLVCGKNSVKQKEEFQAVLMVLGMETMH
jgi:predicted DNA-binding protein with PD1-like motif